jgi:hypothetical protein
MSIKAETISQFEGFGNRKQKSFGEHYRSSGFTASPFGMTASDFLYKWFSDYQVGSTDFPDFEGVDFAPINHLAYGLGYDTSASGGQNPSLFYLDNEGNIFISDDGIVNPTPVYPHLNSSHFGVGYQGGLIVDQKNRLLFAGERYLGMFDPTVDSSSMVVTITAGTDDVVRVSGDNFLSSHVRQFLIITTGGDTYFYRISNYTDANNIVLFPDVDNIPSGNYSATIGKAWVDRWKDFGSDMDGNTAEGYDTYIPTETYEDTVLFGRGNVITSLNTVTDTVTTDSVPAFDMPTGFDCLSIHRGANGILLGFNFQGKGYLVLWDNYSDRSIAPWIPLPDRLISLCKYNGGWIAITAREFYYTNGYSIEVLANKVLDMDIDPLEPQQLPNTSWVIENDLYFITDFSLHGKRRAGIHKMNLTTKLVEYIPRADMNQKTSNVRCLFYGGSVNRMYAGQEDSLGYIERASQPQNVSFITNPVGKGENVKHSEAVKLDLGISPTYYLKDSPFTYEVAVKVCSADQQVINYGLVKTVQTVSTEIVVNETTYGEAEVGDEIEFLMGGNAGYSRNIVSKSGTGATVTYTLDRALPALSSANDYFFRTKFQLVRAKTFTDVTKIDPALLFFDVKNKVKGKMFLIKVDIEDATVPIEMRPLQFVYDDLGVY